MRAATLLLVLAACDPELGSAPTSKIFIGDKVAVVCTAEEDVSGATVIPYRAGGAFEVLVCVDTQFANTTHATAEIVTSDIVPGATLSASVTLDEDGTFLVGKLPLSWPRGGTFDYAVGLAGERIVRTGQLEEPTLTPGPMTSSNDGSKTTVDACLDSSTTDGSIAVRLDGGTFKDGTSQATLTLGPGACVGDAAANPSSHARFTAITKQSTVGVSATVVGAGCDAQAFTLDAQTFGPVSLDFPCPPPATAGSIVELNVTATRTGSVEDIAVTFDATPAVVFVPATASTDEHGTATVRFQKPAGSVYVRARAGADVKACTID